MDLLASYAEQDEDSLPVDDAPAPINQKADEGSGTLEDEWLSFEQMIAPGTMGSTEAVDKEQYLVSGMVSYPGIAGRKLTDVVDSDSNSNSSDLDDANVPVTNNEDQVTEGTAEEMGDDDAFFKLRQLVRDRERSSSRDDDSDSLSSSSRSASPEKEDYPSPPQLSPVNSISSPQSAAPPDLVDALADHGDAGETDAAHVENMEALVEETEVTAEPERKSEEEKDTAAESTSKERKRSRSRDRKTSHRSRSRSKHRHSGSSKAKKRRSRSRSKDRKRHSARDRHRHRDKKSRHGSRDRKRSKSRDRKRSKSRERKQSDSKDRKRSRSKDRKRSKSKDRKRSKSKDRKRSKSKDRKRSKSNDTTRSKSKERHRSKSTDKLRSKSKERKRSKSKDRKRSKSKDRKRSKSKDRKRSKSKDRKRSRSKDRKRSKSRDRKHRSRSRSKVRDRKDRRRSKSRERKRDRSKEKKLKARDRKLIHRKRSRSRERSRERLRSRSPMKNKKLTFKEQMRKDLLTSGKDVQNKAIALPKASEILKDLRAHGNAVTPQMALLQTMAAMHQKAQELTGVAVPKYYNPAAVNPLKYAEQVQKRKLLWSKKGDEKEKEKDEQIESQWKSMSLLADQDGKAASKFRKLMGIREDDTGEEIDMENLTDEQIQKQAELFSRLDKEYEFARMATHTHRGVGLGFASQSYNPNFPTAAPGNSNNPPP